MNDGCSSIDDLKEQYRSLTVVDLKKKLRGAGLKPRGVKKDLILQLAEKEYDRLTAFNTIKLVKKLGFDIVKRK